MQVRRREGIAYGNKLVVEQVYREVSYREVLNRAARYIEVRIFLDGAMATNVFTVDDHLCEFTAVKC
jgi:hypothetical protein